MIYLFAALHAEISPLLAPLAAQPIQGENRFRQWRFDAPDGLITLTGTGPYAASRTVASVLSVHPCTHGDMLLSIGTCAALNPQCATGTLYRIHSLVDLASQKRFYPDLLLASALPEASLLTGGQILDVQKKSVWMTDADCVLPDLYDMESAAIFSAASLFMGPEQMTFLRVVSDSGDGVVTSEDVRDQITHTMPEILQVMDDLSRFGNALSAAQSSAPAIPYALAFQDFLMDLRATHAMQEDAEKLLHYAVLVRFPLHDWILRARQDHRLPCKDKKEGVELLERLRHELRLYEC